MNSHDWLRKLFGRPQGSTRRMPIRRPRRTRLLAEQLELRYLLSGGITEFPVPTAGGGPAAIATGPDGNLWFTEFNSNRIGRITPAGVVMEFVVHTANSVPDGITAGPDGNLWFTEEHGNQIGRITPTGTITEFPVLTTGSGPEGITAGPDGNLWFTEGAGNKIGRITPTGTVSEFLVPTANSGPVGIAAGPDGNLWFTEVAANQIGRITPAGTIAEFGSLLGGTGPNAIAAGPDGNLWFTEAAANKIGRISTDGASLSQFSTGITANSDPDQIAVGPDGNLWFTEYNSNHIARITPGGTVTEFAVPTVNGGPIGLTSGPDGNVWFTEYNSNKIGRMSLLSITTTTLADWTQNQPGYNQTIRATGGTGTIAFSVTAGSLPFDLTLSSNGVFSGVPYDIPGSSTFTVTATDSVGATSTQTYTVTINVPVSVGITTLANFNGVNGSQSNFSLVEDSSGNLFGTTVHGGPGYTGSRTGNGTVFEVHQGSGIVTTLASFDGTNGANPYCNLIEDSSGNLFGTTGAGGPGWTGPATGDGTVFEVQKGSGTITPLASFNGANGIGPGGGLVEDSSGNLFGIAGGGILPGGGAAYGTVFEVQQGSGTITPLAFFNYTNGAGPEGLVEDSSGNLFGTTIDGGKYGDGTVFEVPQGSGTVITLASFLSSGTLGGSDYPSPVVEDSSGNLFGTTAFGGGPLDYGTVFEVQKGSGTITTLVTFNGDNGLQPGSGLIMDSSGNLFGTTEAGGAGYGNVFELPKGSGTVITLVSFNSDSGGSPVAGVIEDSSGNLFGTTLYGGASGDGTVYAGEGTVFEVRRTLASGTVKQPGYSQTFPATGGSGALTFSAAAFGLPPGLSLSSAGVLSGTPTAVGTFQFAVTATDSTGASASATSTVAINLPVTIATRTLADWTFFQPGYQQTLLATGGSGTITFSVTAGNLPRGLTLTSSGVLSGTPFDNAGSYSFTVTATDSVAATGSQSYTIAINPPVSIGVKILAGFDNSNGAFPIGGVVRDGSGNLFGTTSQGGGPANAGTVFEVQPSSGAITSLFSFNGTNGTDPKAGLTLDSSGNLFGATAAGGPFDDGTVFELQKGNTNITPLISFNGADGAGPEGRLIEDSSGNLFGTTIQGGTLPGGGTGYGTVFEVKPASATLTTLATFTYDNGSSPYGALALDSSGDLFGTTEYGGSAGFGTVFELPHGSGIITPLVTFNKSNGAYPRGDLLLDSSGNLLGTTSQGGGPTNAGTIFDVQPGSGTFSTLATFNAPVGGGNQPDLIEDSSGNLFGTTFQDNGTVFEVHKGSSTITTLAAFNYSVGVGPQGALALDSSGNLFGSTYLEGGSGYGTVFEISPNLPSGTVNQPGYSHTFTATGGTGTLTFSAVAASLPPGLTLSSADVLSGTPIAGGTFQFAVTATDTTGASASATYTVTINTAVSLGIVTLATFTGTNGKTPQSGLIEDSSGNVFGTTTQGGASGKGTAFEVQKGTGVLTNLANFTSGFSQRALVEDGSGNFFGTTFGGTVFEVHYGTDAFATIASVSDGGILSDLLLDNCGNLFGTTSDGGAARLGSVFEVQPGSGTVTTLASFDLSSGVNPDGGVIEDSSGNLFGTTNDGGANNDGTVFELPKGSGTVTSVASFNGTNGAASQSALVMDSSGDLFGTAYYGGAFGDGTVFEVAEGSGIITPLVSFSGTNGANPQSALLMDSGGNLFGTTSDGGLSHAGTVFEVQAGSGMITTLGSFNGINGRSSPAGLVEDQRGNLFGTTVFGGIYNDGTVFELIATLPDATAGTGYSQSLVATGGTGTLTYSQTAGTLPPGLTLSSGGILAGTPITVGTYTFTVTATDSVGASDSHNYSITVGAGPFSQYQVAVVGSSTVQADSSFLVTVQAADQYGNPITSYSGPATVTASIAPTSTASSFPTTVTIPASGLGFFLAKLQQTGTYTISVADSSNTFTGSAAPVIVTAGPAARMSFATQPVNTPTGDLLPAVTVQIQDLYGNVVTSDNSDSVTLSVGSGPGSFTTSSTTTATVHNGVATFGNLTLVVPGRYTLSAVVSGLFHAASAAFAVAPLQMVPGSFAGTPSGFSLQFNTAFLVNSLTPVLYGQGFGATAPLPSVTLTQTKDASGNPVNNPVEGSLVLNTATNRITFVATNTAYEANGGAPQLPDGTYTAVVHSNASNDGFQALNVGGGFLDGSGTGVAGSGDFTATFTVSAAAASDDVLWVPATANGPGQALSAPGMNQVGGGYPIYLSDRTGAVTDVKVTLNYDPTLLTVTGVTGAGFALLGSSTPGQAVMQYSGPALPTGSQTPIGYLKAMVPNGTVAKPTPSKAKDLLHLSNVALNGGAIPVVTSDGLHLVAYVGDGDGNGSYSNNDAVLITRVALQTDTGFTAYPLVDPVIVADTDGAGFIPADAPLQANEAGVGFPTANLTIPPIPTSVHFRSIANNVDPSVSLPSNLHVGADGTVAVPVNIDDAHPAGSSGLTEAHLALTYDPRQFSASAADVHLGTVLAAGSGWSMDPTINPVTGQIAIALTSNTPIASALGGSLVSIDFHQIGTSAGSAQIALVASVNPTGQQVVSTELEDAQGIFTLSPAPTIGFDPRIDSVVSLTATPAAAVASRAVVEATSNSTQVVVETQAADSRTVDAFLVATTNPILPAPAPESSAQPLVVGPSATADTAIPAVSAASVHGAAVFVAASSLPSPTVGELTTVPITGLVFQFGNVPAVAASSAGVGVAQHAADQWFQALARGTLSPLEPAQLVSTVKDAFERALATQLRMSPGTADNLDSLSWDEVSSDVEWQGAGDSIARVGHRGRRDATVTSTPSPATVQQTVADRAILDQYFAQVANDSDQTTDDD